MADKEIKFNIEAIADEALKKVQQLQQEKDKLKQDVSFDVDANTTSAAKSIQELQAGMKALQKVVRQFKGININTASYKDLEKMTDAFADVFGNFNFDKSIMRKSQKQYYNAINNLWSDALQMQSDIRTTNTRNANKFLMSQGLDNSIIPRDMWQEIREGSLTAEQALDQLRDKLGAVNNEASKTPVSGSGIDSISEDAESASKSLAELEKQYNKLSRLTGTSKSSLYDRRQKTNNLLGELSNFDQSDEQVKSLISSVKNFQTQINSQIQSLSNSPKISQQTQEITELEQAAESAAKSSEKLAESTKKLSGSSGKKSSNTDSEKAITAAYNQRIKLMERISKAQTKYNTATTTQSRITASNNLEQLKNTEQQLINIQKAKTVLNKDGQEISLFDAVDVQYGEQLVKTAERLNQEMENISKKASSIQSNDAFKKIQTARETGSYEKELETLQKRLDSVTPNSAKSMQLYEDLLAQQSEMQSLAKKLQTGQDTVSGSVVDIPQDEMIEYQKRFENLTKLSKNTYSQMQDDIKKYITEEEALARSNKLQKKFEQNTKAASEYGKEMKEAIETVRSAQTEEQAAAGEAEFNKLLNQAENQGLSGHSRLQTITDMAKKFTSWYGVAQFTMEAVDGLRQMYQAVVDVDSAMIELRKVSDSTSQEIDAYFSTAADNAQELGVSVSDMINSTADFSRLGYDLSDSEELARVATLYKNVGENMDIDTASSNIISTMQAFGVEADDAISIVDKFNEVANKYAIDTGGLGDALARSASSMEAANNTLDETIALITAADEVVQDPDSVGNAMKTISMRIRGAKTELSEAGESTDGMVESTAKLREEVMALSGVDIMQNKD